MKVKGTLALFLAVFAAADNEYALVENTTNTSSPGGNENKQGTCRFVGGADTCQGQSPEDAFFGDSPLQPDPAGVDKQYFYDTLQGDTCVIKCEEPTSCLKFKIMGKNSDPRHYGFFSSLPPEATTEDPGYNPKGHGSFILCLPGGPGN